MPSTQTDRLYGENSAVAIKAPVLGVATTNIALTGLQAIGLAANEGDRVLVIGQTDPTTNGIYNESGSTWQRSGDFDGYYDVVQGTLVPVVLPAAAVAFYQLTTISPVIGTTALNFSPLASSPDLTYPQLAIETAAGVAPTNTAYPYPDPRRYGAKGDGVTDDSGAFNTAVQALDGGAGTIPIPAGCTFALAASIALNSLTNVTFLGLGGKMVLTANVAAFSFTLCRACNVINVPIYGRYNGGAGYNGQFGVFLSQCGGCLIADNDIHDMVGATGGYGPPAAVSVNSVLIPADLGQALPNIVRNNALQRCTVGVYANGEYEEILGNTATACTTGIWLIAGNCYVTANICQGNNIGCTVDGTGSNADHCLIAGNTFNHNYQCGLELVNIGRSATVTGNVIYAQINYGTEPPFGSTGLYIGVYIGNSSNVNLLGNVIARNQCNLYLDFAAGGGVISSIVSQNTFATDSANTTYNIKYTGTFDFADNIIGRNTFSGALVAGADDNDTDRVVLIGGTIPGAPAFTNSWANYGSGNASAGYWRTLDNVVHLQGLVTGGAAGTAVFTLPADLWPTQAHHFVTHGSANPCYVSVNTTGTVVVDNLGTGSYVSLDGIAFRIGS